MRLCCWFCPLLNPEITYTIFGVYDKSAFREEVLLHYFQALLYVLFQGLPY